MHTRKCWTESRPVLLAYSGSPPMRRPAVWYSRISPAGSISTRSSIGGLRPNSSVWSGHMRVFTIEGARIDRRPWMLRYQSPDWTPESVADDVRELRRFGGWEGLIGVEALAEGALQELDILQGLSSLLHLDCDPSNAGIATNEPCQVALIDWDMAGWGAPELDLAYLYLHPFEAAASVERTRLLEIYWSEWDRLGVPIPDEGERRSRQRVADQVFALALVRIARRSLNGRYPAGGRTDRYWSAMRPVLSRRLAELIG